MSTTSAPEAISGEFRGYMADGYDADDVNRVLGAITEATGVRLVCVWKYYDDAGVGGNSQFYVATGDGDCRLRELTGELWAWLGGDPDTQGTPASPRDPSCWPGAYASFCQHDLMWDDGLHNFARTHEYEGARRRSGVELITRAQAEAWAGRPLSDQEMHRLDDAIPNSSIPEAISQIVDGFADDDENNKNDADDEGTEPGPCPTATATTRTEPR